MCFHNQFIFVFHLFDSFDYDIFDFEMFYAFWKLHNWQQLPDKYDQVAY